MFNAELDGRGEFNIAILKQRGSGNEVRIVMNPNCSREDWDEFTTLIDNLGDTMDAMLNTSEEEGFTVSTGNTAHIIVENVEVED